MTDITEPKRVREALAASQERFITVLDELDAAVSVFREDGEHLFVNEAYRTQFGERSAQSLMTDLKIPLSSNLVPSAHEAREKDAQHNEFSALWDPPNATAPLGRWFDARVREIRWVDASLVKMLVAVDISVRHELEQKQRDHESRLQSTSRLVTMGEMASSLAHELNQPLTAISNYCMGLTARIKSMAQFGHQPDTDTLLEPLHKTAHQAERAGLVIRRIREFVKRSEPERKACSVDAIVSDAVGLAELEAKRLGVAIETDITPNLPTLYADPILIEQVLINLLKNAVEASAQKHAQSSPVVLLEVKLPIDDVLVFSVFDEGGGVAKESLEKLFQPFFSTKAEGMGMGLNICRSIIELHQGRLWVEPNLQALNGGSIFRFTLGRTDAVGPAHSIRAAVVTD